MSPTSSARTLAPPASGFGHRPWLSEQRIGDWALGVLIFLSGFVLYEPAPYDLLVPLMFVFAALSGGLKLNRHILPLIVLLLLLEAGGLIAFTQTSLFAKAAVKLLTTLLLAGSAIYYAAIVSDDPERRLRVIARAYVASAVVAGAIGILGYFHLIPGSELFTKYGRAMGPFQDPNVFGPFLVLPAVLLARGLIVERAPAALARMLWLLVILLAIFLAGSRAAWGMTVFSVLFVVLIDFINERRPSRRLRILFFVALGLVATTLLLAAALSVPAISDLISQRAHLVEEYDSGRLGRFARWVIGFFMVQEHPLGIGPFRFGLMFGEDEHNTWLKGFTVYGWLGGAAYLTLAAWTLRVATPLLFRAAPWRAFYISSYAAFLAHLFSHILIDQDSWRHVFLMYGILWGGVAAERIRLRRAVAAGGSSAPARPRRAIVVAGLPRAQPAV